MNEYNLASIRRQVMEDRLDDTDYESNVIDNFINATQREIFNTYELEFQEEVFSGSLPQGARTFTFPENMQIPLSIVITGPDGSQRNIMDKYIRFRDFNKLYPTPDNGTPGPIFAWTSFAGNMVTSAPIDRPYVMDTFYLKKPKLLIDDSDVPEIPEEFQEVLVLGAYKRVLERNEDFDYAAVIENKYQAQLELMVDRYGVRMSNGPIKMRRRGVIHRGS